MDRNIDFIVNEYARQVHKTYNPKEIYLYGSYARGEEKQHSDIDIAVVLEHIDIKKYLDVYGELWSIAAHIDGRIEPKLIIDDGKYDKYSFLYEVKKTGVKIEV